MKILPQTRVEWMLGGAIVFIVGLIGLTTVKRIVYPPHIIYWVGITDIEVTFCVVDADTGQPIPAASINIHSERGLCYKEIEQDFLLTTDQAGTVKRLAGDCMCFGRAGPDIDTFGSHLPSWEYQVSAPGYETSDKIRLDWSNNHGRVVRGKRSEGIPAKVVEVVRLQTKRP